MIKQAKCCETAAKNVQEQMKNCHTGVALIIQEQKVIVYEHYQVKHKNYFRYFPN